jgi:hypothetical protein
MTDFSFDELAALLAKLLGSTNRAGSKKVDSWPRCGYTGFFRC